MMLCVSKQAGGGFETRGSLDSHMGKTNGLMVQWFNGLMVHWFNGSLDFHMRKTIGLIVYWFNGLLVYWFVGLMVHWISICGKPLV